jgi:hypothetical protein
MPIDMTSPTLAHPKVGSKLDRAIASKAARLLDAKQLREWATAVKARDLWKDRKTGVTVHRTRQLDPLRAEAHHIESKDNPDTRYDVRNGICLSMQTHLEVSLGRYRIDGTVFFRKNGAQYIDGTFPITFIRT